MTIEIKSLASGSAGNCYFLSDGKTPLLIDCGIPWRAIQRKLNYQSSQIAACLVTHKHGDHIKAIKQVAKAGIRLYGPILDIALPPLKYHHLLVAETREIGSWKVVPFDAVHDERTFGYLLRSAEDLVLFLTDTAYCKYKVQGITHLMIEANYSQKIIDGNVKDGHLEPFLRDRIIQSHMSIERVMDFLAANDLSQLKEIHLLHLSDANSDEKLFQSMVEKFTGVPTYVH